MPDGDTQTTPELRRWVTWPKGWALGEDGGHVVRAATREEARMKSLRAAHDAGYYDLEYTDMRAVLAKDQADAR